MTLQAKRALEIELQAKRALELEEQREKEKKEIQQAVAANLQIFREQHAAAGTRTHVVVSVITVVKKTHLQIFREQQTAAGMRTMQWCMW